MESFDDILQKYQFREEPVSEYDKDIFMPFLIKITKIYHSSEKISLEDVKKITNFLNMQRVFVIIRSPFFEEFVFCKRKDIKFFQGGGEIYFEYIGKNIFDTEYVKIPLCEIIFVGKSNFIVLWDHECYLTICQFERVKASKI